LFAKPSGVANPGAFRLLFAHPAKACLHKATACNPLRWLYVHSFINTSAIVKRPFSNNSSQLVPTSNTSSLSPLAKAYSFCLTTSYMVFIMASIAFWLNK
jgi:hypothetical protein